MTEFGRYDLRDPIGEGGMGTVWKAWDPAVERFVAVKIMRPEESAWPDAHARFLREARLAAKLRHDGIVRLLDVGEVDGQPYLTMDFVAGRTFESWLSETRASRRAGDPEAVTRLRAEIEILAQVAAAVAYAHAEGVVHRDLKPANVLLDGDGRPRVTDFGLAKDLPRPGGESAFAGTTGITLDGTSLGTPEYMSPEQTAGDLDRIGPRTDVWSLGVILYEIIAGVVPFAHEQVWDVLKAIVREEPRRPGARRPHVPAELEAVCLSALEKDPEERLAGAGEFAGELRRWLAGEPVRARRPGVARRLGRWTVRHRALLAAGAAVLLMGGLAAGVAAWSSRRAQERVRGLLLDVAAAVGGFEDQVRRTAAPPEARRSLAEQPLGLLERLVREDPRWGPAYSWRGRVRELLGDADAADADYDRGVAESPGLPVVWWLRGLSRLHRYGRSRGLPPVTTGMGGVAFEPMRAETPQEAAWREQGLADLARMTVATGDAATPEGDLRTGRAIAAFYAGGAEGAREAVRLLDGLAGPRAAKLRALALHHDARFEEAAGELDRVLAAWPEDLEARQDRGDAHHARAVEALARGRNPADALAQARADYDAVLARDPERAETLSARARARLVEGEAGLHRGEDPEPALRAAVADFSAALGRVPGASSWLAARGTAWESLGESRRVRGRDARECYRNAIADFGEALGIDANSASTWNNRGNAWRGLGDAQRDGGEDPRPSYRHALDDLDRAVELDARDAGARANRGSVRRSLAEAERTYGGDPMAGYRAAIEDFAAAVKLSPRYVLAYNNRGNAYANLAGEQAARGEDPRGTLRLAIADFEEALRLSPDFATVYNNRGLARLQLGEHEEAAGGDPREHYRAAVADFGETVRRNPALFGVYVNRGEAQRALARQQGRRGEDPRPAWRGAVDDYGAALARNPDLPGALEGRGRSWLGFGEAQAARGEDPREAFDAAVRDLREVLRSVPGSAPTWLACGVAGARRADAAAEYGEDARPFYARAVADLELALKHDARLDEALEERGFAWRGLGDERLRRGEDPAEAYDAATADFGALMVRRPDDGRPWSWRGNVALRRGDAEQRRGEDPGPWFRAAESDYLEAIQRRAYEAYLNLGALYRAWERWEDALTAFEAGAKAVPERKAWAEAQRAEVRERMGR